MMEQSRLSEMDHRSQQRHIRATTMKSHALAEPSKVEAI